MYYVYICIYARYCVISTYDIISVIYNYMCSMRSIGKSNSVWQRCHLQVPAAQKFRSLAEGFAKKWVEMAKSGDLEQHDMVPSPARYGDV